MLDIIHSAIELLIQKKEEGRNILIWGTGIGGEYCYKICRRLGINISFFVDASKVKHNTKFHDNLIVGPDWVETNKHIFILVANKYYDEIKDSLIGLGFKERSDFIDFIDFDGVKIDAYTRAAERYFAQYEGSKQPLFKSIEIETVNSCNMDCSFCPCNKYADKRVLHYMDETLFDSIINQLAALNYDESIALFANNEPFIDRRISGFIEKVKNALPRAFLFLYSNGTLLTLDKFLEIIKYLDLLVLDNYDDSYEFITPIKEIYNYCLKNADVSQKVKIQKRKKNEVLHTRGGKAPNKEVSFIEGSTCLYPFQQLVINSSGMVGLCINDLYTEYTLGNVNYESIVDIWYGDKYRKVRENIRKGRENFTLCKFCDARCGITNYNEKWLERAEKWPLLQINDNI